MSLRERLEEDYKAAMKAGDALKVSVIRMARSEIRNTEIARRHPLSEEEIAEVVAREIKRRQESIEQFARGGRSDLVDKETAEKKILEAYLPKQLEDSELTDIAQEVIAELNATSKADKGRVMGALMQRVRGRADGRLVSDVVERLLERSSA